jgi:hypothetical protein
MKLKKKGERRKPVERTIHACCLYATGNPWGLDLRAKQIHSLTCAEVSFLCKEIRLFGAATKLPFVTAGSVGNTTEISGIVHQ